MAAYEGISEGLGVIVCGVSGYLSTRDLSVEVSQILALQECRGPDDRGFWSWVTQGGLQVGLGHNRLSIIDLTSQGHQPMTNPEQTVALSFNGEIYNYRELRHNLQRLGYDFRSHSDTEVLLAAYTTWGEQAWDHLNGMFALIVVDLGESTLHLVRSRMGSKPLAYTKWRDGWLFASTADSLARVTHAQVNFDYVARGAVSWAFDGNSDETAFQGVRQVLPGTSLTFDLDRVTSCEPRFRRWYSLRAALSPFGSRNTQTAVEAVRASLSKSVDLRLRSDVPVGVSLSGGLDSASLAALASERLDSPLAAYSYRWGPADPESANVQALASKLGASKIQMHWVDPPTRGQLSDVMHHALLSQGSPVAGLSVVAQSLVFRTAREDNTVVMLGGQGADEILMGYRKYQVAQGRSLLRSARYLAATRTGLDLAATLMRDRAEARDNWSAARRYLPARTQHGLGLAAATDSDLRVPMDNPLAISLADISVKSLPTLLRYEDRNSMAFGVESRLPFLDRHVVELALSLPNDIKVRGGFGKWVLRQAMAPLLPDSIAWSRAKRGFNAGDARWVQLGVGSWLRQRVADGARGLADLGVDASVADPCHFTDARLIVSRQAMSEAMVLAWLATWEQERRKPVEGVHLTR